MSLLAELIEKTSATEVRAQVRVTSSQPDMRVEHQVVSQQQRQVAEFTQVRRAGLSASPNSSAATASAEWRHARDAYINHLMGCRSCYAPTGRYCRRGTELRAAYVATPMETQQ